MPRGPPGSAAARQRRGGAAAVSARRGPPVTVSSVARERSSSRATISGAALAIAVRAGESWQAGGGKLGNQGCGDQGETHGFLQLRRFHCALSYGPIWRSRCERPHRRLKCFQIKTGRPKVIG